MKKGARHRLNYSAMIAIKFTDPGKRELGLRIIVLSGTVQYTTTRGVYYVPRFVLKLLKDEGVPYETVEIREQTLVA